jgi:hypothetical protein
MQERWNKQQEEHQKEVDRLTAEVKKEREAREAAEAEAKLAQQGQGKVRKARTPGPRSSKEFGSKNKVFTSEKAEAARARIMSKTGRLHAGLDPEMLSDLTTLGGYYIEAGLREFAEWRSALLADHPGLTEENLQVVWTNARDALNAHAKKLARPLSKIFVDKMTRRLTRKGATDLANAINTERPGLLDRMLEGKPVTDDEKAWIEQTYLKHAPKRKTPSKPEGAVKIVTDAVAEIKRDKQLHAQIEAINKELAGEKPTDKTARQRKEATDRIKALQRERTIQQRKLGVKNRIAAIRAGIRPQPRKASPTDPELQKLRGERDLANKEAKAKEKLADITDQNRRGIVREPIRRPKPTSPELERLKQETATQQEQRAARLRVARIDREIAGLENQIKTGKFEDKPVRPSRKIDPKLEEARRAAKLSKEIADRKAGEYKAIEAKQKAEDSARVKQLTQDRDNLAKLDTVEKVLADLRAGKESPSKPKGDTYYDQSNTYIEGVRRQIAAERIARRNRKRLADINAELDARANGTWEPKPKPARAEMPEDIRQASARLALARAKTDAEVKAIAEPPTTGQRIVQYTRAAKLSGPRILAKLASLSFTTPITEYASDIFGYPWGRLPAEKGAGGRTLYDVTNREFAKPSLAREARSIRKGLSENPLQALREGAKDVVARQGLKSKTKGVVKTAASTLFSKRVVGNMIQQWVHHTDELYALAGEGHKASASEIDAYLGAPGKAHGVEKTYLKLTQNEKSLEIRTQRQIERFRKQGMSEGEIERQMKNPEVMMEIGIGAANDALRSIMMHDNKIAAQLNSYFAQGARSKAGEVRVVANLIHSFLPVVRAPLNHLIAVGRMTTAGIPEGLFRYKMAYDKLKPGETIPTEDAERMGRALRYGGLGGAAMLVGSGLLPGFKAAGYGNHTPKGPDGKFMQRGSIQVGNTVIPPGLAFNPFFVAANFHATWINEGNAAWRKEQSAWAATEGLSAGMASLLAEAPGERTVGEVTEAINQKGYDYKSAVGFIIRGDFEPEFFTDLTEHADKPLTGSMANKVMQWLMNPSIPREQKDAMQVVLSGIPGARQMLPIEGLKKPRQPGDQEERQRRKQREQDNAQRANDAMNAKVRLK